MNEAEESMKKLLDSLDFDIPNDEVSDVTQLSDLDLYTGFYEITQQLLTMGEARYPRTQEARDLHSRRAAFKVEMSRRGLK